MAILHIPLLPKMLFTSRRQISRQSPGLIPNLILIPSAIDEQQKHLPLLLPEECYGMCQGMCNITTWTAELTCQTPQ
jgi:hypothetical protein